MCPVMTDLAKKKDQVGDKLNKAFKGLLGQKVNKALKETPEFVTNWLLIEIMTWKRERY